MSAVLLIGVLIILLLAGIGYIFYALREINKTNDTIDQVERRHYTLLKISVPKNNQKSPLAAEQMFSSLHGIYRKSEVVQDHFSFEIAATPQAINFFMLVPTHLRDFIEGQVYAQYPTVEIEQTSDYSNVSLENKSIAGADIALTKNDYYPIKTFQNFDVDPLAGITGVLSKIEDGELLAIQAVMSPIDDSWQKEGIQYVKDVKDGKSFAPPPPLSKELQKKGKSIITKILLGMFSALSAPPAKDDKKKEEKKEIKLSGPEEVALKGIESKVTKLGYAMSIRILAVTNDPILSQTRVESIAGAFKQFNVANLNGFDLNDVATDGEYLKQFRSRNLSTAPFRLNTEEIASVFHFPDISVATPSISWAGSKKGEPPLDLPLEGEVDSKDLTTFGMTSFRNRRMKFGIKALDRMLHFYIIGKTGTGKSTLIENMIYDDIKEGRGVAVIDPHGELIDKVLSFIPEERINDVVYFAPDDREYPLAFNLLENVQPDMRNIVASGLMSIFTKLWAGVWSARMEYILRNAIMAALEVPDATLLSIMRILNDTMYRKYVMSFVTDPVVRDFFINEYDKYDAKFRQEAIAPIQNKVGQFLSSTTIRNIVGQPKSTFNIEDVMNTQKIFLVDLSIGKIGEDNSKLLGSMMVTKIQLAAMSRARIAREERKPFFLYVDEFQNFATDSFATILSEARKYALGLVLANQYIAQIPEIVADAIFGNVGTTVSFRVGADDADRLVKQYAPTFEANDLINLPNRQIYVKMAIDGVTSLAFSAHTLPPKGVVTEITPQIIDGSRKRYSRPRAQVEEEITEATQATFMTETDKDYESIRTMRPLILDGTMYKEFSGKGGERWYFGQPPEILAEELAKIEAEKNGLPWPPEGSEPTDDTPAEHQVADAPVPAAEPAPAPVAVPMPQPETAAPALVAVPEPIAAPALVHETALAEVTPEPSAVVPYHEPALPIVASEDGSGKRKRKRRRKKKGNGEQMTYVAPEPTVPVTELHEMAAPEVPTDMPQIEPQDVAVAEPALITPEHNEPTEELVVTPVYEDMQPIPEVPQDERLQPEQGREVALEENTQLPEAYQATVDDQAPQTAPTNTQWLPLDELS